jgi:hypothetical protein
MYLLSAYEQQMYAILDILDRKLNQLGKEHFLRQLLIKDSLREKRVIVL